MLHMGSIFFSLIVAGFKVWFPLSQNILYYCLKAIYGDRVIEILKVCVH